ncbi:MULTISPECIES: hypothetical protein [Micromonospora]|uniref:Uncharacterized protein n=2 Tax=Micromonospora TaxID=1873 RepID=A0ABQ4IA12_9ACTN|nr:MULTISPECIES: hypothetical protein [Micromonospora]GIJ14754.1 hypothetical protein Vgi01_14380 [Micromonospora gifhornensis]
MSFNVVTRTGTPTPSTDTYPINQWRVIDLTTTDIPEGTDVRPVVSATAGNTVPGNRFVSYCQNGQTATYTASGTTLDYQVTLVQ